MARLSVNLNKIALLRNSRHTGVPDLLAYPALVREGGGLGITVHPRPDQRHIRRTDVPALARVIADWRPAFEYNIEGRPDEDFMALVESVKPDQCTLVPDAPEAFTSESGWKLDTAEIVALKPMIERLKAMGSRVILFVDPDPEVVGRVKATGADGLEIYTGSYVEAFRRGSPTLFLNAIATLGERAKLAGLMVNAGHDLNRETIPGLIEAVPHLHEASIGHELTADALLDGFVTTVRHYAKVLQLD
jgi:pyridoxine 5-phosphate synthase